MSLEVGQTADRGDQFPARGRTAQPDAADMDGPLVGDAAGLRASWQRIQAGFVDDPRESVADAAALVEHAAQALVGTLRQRQQQLRGRWDTTAARDDAGPRTTDPAPTGRMPIADQTSTADETRAAFAASTANGARSTDGTRTADSGVVADSGMVADSGAPADGVRGGRAAAGAVPDTEQLRLLMRRYRSLLEQICPPQ